ncbi:MAG: DNA polymerase IV [Blautia sp.]|nr:DNA polymerase IV [Blautia sp.]MCM1202014.1 DNA polymerase IV [Bacteroides fragilis]
MERIIFHIDVNSAFLSWSALDKIRHGSDIDLRTIPAIIGGDMAKRHGVVLAKSIPAKAFGIVTGEPIVNAMRKCPGLHIEPPDHELYHLRSGELMRLLSDICPDLEQVSIDECYMDYTPVQGRFSSPKAAAEYIRAQIRERLGFTVNVGISDRKVLAKMASDFKKPDLTHTLYSCEIQEKMWPLPVSSLFLCGHSSVETLHKLEILTIGDLAKSDVSILTSHLKSHGKMLWEYANGIDDSIVETEASEAKGIGNSITLEKDASSKEEARHFLLELSESVARRLRNAGQTAEMVSVEIKYNTFKKVSHQTTLQNPTAGSDTIYRTACALFDELWDGTPIRLLGIRSSRLFSAQDPVQLTLFDLPAIQPAGNSSSPRLSAAKEERLEKALDSIRQKYGAGAIVRGSLLQPKSD